MNSNADEERERRKRQRMRSLAIALALGALVALFYIATIVRLGRRRVQPAVVRRLESKQGDGKRQRQTQRRRR